MAEDDNRDIGDLLEVSRHQRKDEDPPIDEQLNDDVDADLSHVPPGHYVELSTAEESEPVGEGNPDDEFDDDEEGR